MLDLSLPLRLLLPALAGEPRAGLEAAAAAEGARPRPRKALLAALNAELAARQPADDAPPAPPADPEPAGEPSALADETRAVSRWPDPWLDADDDALAEEVSRRGREGTITIRPVPPPPPPEADAPPPPPPPRGNCLVRPRSP